MLKFAHSLVIKKQYHFIKIYHIVPVTQIYIDYTRISILKLHIALDYSPVNNNRVKNIGVMTWRKMSTLLAMNQLLIHTNRLLKKK